MCHLCRCSTPIVFVPQGPHFGRASTHRESLPPISLIIVYDHPEAKQLRVRIEIFMKDLPKLGPYYVNGAISHTINVMSSSGPHTHLGALVGSMNLIKSRGLPPLRPLFIRGGAPPPRFYVLVGSMR